MLQQAKRGGAGDRVRTRVHPELVVQRTGVRADRVRGEEQALSDLTVGQVPGQQPQHGELGVARGKRGGGLATITLKDVRCADLPSHTLELDDAVVDLDDVPENPTATLRKHRTASGGTGSSGVEHADRLYDRHSCRRSRPVQCQAERQSRSRRLRLLVSDEPHASKPRNRREQKSRLA